MKQLRVLLLSLDGMLGLPPPPPQQYVAGTHSYTWVERDNVGQSILCLRKQHDGRDLALNRQPSDPNSNALTTAAPRPHPHYW